MPANGQASASLASSATSSRATARARPVCERGVWGLRQWRPSSRLPARHKALCAAPGARWRTRQSERGAATRASFRTSQTAMRGRAEWARPLPTPSLPRRTMVWQRVSTEVCLRALVCHAHEKYKSRVVEGSESCTTQNDVAHLPPFFLRACSGHPRRHSATTAVGACSKRGLGKPGRPRVRPHDGGHGGKPPLKQDWDPRARGLWAARLRLLVACTAESLSAYYAAVGAAGVA